MESVITKKGQVVVPVALRRKYGIAAGTRVIWIDTGSVIKLMPIPKDPVTALRGCSEGEALTRSLLRDRKEDKKLEG
ncbi:MAG: AbrB/MazE/SpoVT family DNA-binding domain-containing protein [Deltaproteobacteria bacterium]|nr:AbrB/MazE/SpoVT family DNA-binding domain-containing protein [Deltaproteobacteria bacterium]MBW2117276.1 AbrB/MazE/SpoVT family DNA-binding domain-containing protein [Deltaproteobacteria bacterium]MBW2345241.1 AbrB/MazE/SpoVT family DNA-binding domain-containing protein [Deltaproteobacteria bacterium]